MPGTTADIHISPQNHMALPSRTKHTFMLYAHMLYFGPAIPVLDI